MAIFELEGPNGEVFELEGQGDQPPSQQVISRAKQAMIQQSGGQQQGQGGVPRFQRPTPTLPPQEAQPSPLSFFERLDMSVPTTVDSKAELLSQMVKPGTEITILPNNKFVIDGIAVDPSPTGFKTFFQDLPSDMLADMFGPGLPVLGQIGFEIAGSPLIAGATAVGGPAGGIAAASALGAAGSAAGQTARELRAKQLINEPINTGAIANQAVIGGFGSGTGRALQPAVSTIIRGGFNIFEKIAKKLGDGFVPVAQGFFGVVREAAERVSNAVASGRSTASFLNAKVADPKFVVDTVRRTFLGSPTAERSIRSVILQARNLVQSAKTSVDKSIIKQQVGRIFGLSSQTVERMLNRPINKLLNPVAVGDDALKMLARRISGSIRQAIKQASQTRDRILKESLEDNLISKRSVDMDDIVTQMLRELDISQGSKVGILEGGSMNPLSTDEGSKVIFKRLFHIIKSLKAKKFTVGQIISVDDFRSLQKVVPDQIGKVKIGDLNKFLINIQSLVDDGFQGSRLSGQGKVVLFKFIKQLRQKFNALVPQVARQNERINTLKTAEEFFNVIDTGDLSATTRVIGFLKKAVSKDPAIRSTAREGLQKIDDLVGKGRILPLLDDITAASELMGTNITDGIENVARLGQRVFTKEAAQEIEVSILRQLDSSIGSSKFKFFENLLDHATADAFLNKPSNFFKGRGLLFLLGGGVGTSLGGVQGAALGAGGTMALSNPRILVSGAQLLQKLLPIIQRGTQGITQATSKQIPRGTQIAAGQGVSAVPRLAQNQG